MAQAAYRDSWDAPLLQLLQDGVLTGFACITSRGQVDASAGCLAFPQQRPQQQAPADGSGGALPSVESFLRLFDGVTPPPLSIDVCGERAVVSFTFQDPVFLRGTLQCMAL